MTEDELVLAEQELADGGPMNDAAMVPNTPSAEHDEHQLLHPDAEVVVAAFAGEVRELREQRGLHGLEQQDRDARR